MPRRSASGWDDLASQLGVVVPEEAATQAPASQAIPAPVKSRPASAGAPAGEPGRAEAAASVSRSADAFTVLPPFAVEETFEELTPPADAGDQEKTGRRRRPRRRRSRGGPAEAPAPAPPAEGEGPAEDARPEQEGGGEEAETAPSPAGSEETSTRTKRRRRRRSGRKKASAEGAAEPESGGPALSQREPAEDEEDELDDDDFPQGQATGDRPRGDRSAAAKQAPPSHRGLPSWEETVGIIISANMESRAKRPSGGSSRSRGGGRPRGGGDRPSSRNAKSS